MLWMAQALAQMISWGRDALQQTASWALLFAFWGSCSSQRLEQHKDEEETGGGMGPCLASGHWGKHHQRSPRSAGMAGPFRNNP